MSETAKNGLEVAPGTIYEVLPDGRWAFFFDNLAISTHSNCEQKFYYRHIARKGPKGGPGWAASVGIWWSKYLEGFYLTLKRGGLASLTPNVAFDLAERAWIDGDMDTIAGMWPKKANRFGGRAAAFVMAAEYWSQFAALDAQDWIVTSAEKGFGYNKEVWVGETDKVVVYYCGRPDLEVADRQGRIFPVENKTLDRIQGDVHARYKPHQQTAGYIYACQVMAQRRDPKIIVNKCIVNVAARQAPSDKPRDGKKKPRFVRVQPHYSPEEIQEWRQQKLAQAERLRFSIEHNIWIMKDSSCHQWSGCEYRGVCSVPPSSRPIAIQSALQDVEPWAPYDGDEDDSSE